MTNHQATRTHQKPTRVPRVRWLFAALGLLLAAAFPASAPAVSLHTPTAFSPITGTGIGAPFALPLSIAADEATGNIFVTSGTRGGNVDNTVDILSSEGKVPSGVASPYKISGFSFGKPPFNGVEVMGLAVDNSNTSPSKGALYVPEEAEDVVKKYVRNPGTETYELVGELPLPSESRVKAVAVDKDGNVFAVTPVGGSSGFGLITKFSPTGEQLLQIEAAKTDRRPERIAVDNAGDLFVSTVESFKVFKYPADPFGQIQASNFEEVPVANGQVGDIKIDRASNTLYVSYGGEAPFVTEYDAASLLEKGDFEFPAGVNLALNHAAGVIYAADSFATRSIYAVSLDGPTLADAGTTAPTEVSATKVTLNGVVNPQGLAIGECNFEFDAKLMPCEGALPTDSFAHAVTAHVSGLTRNGSYGYRLVVSNSNGTNRSGLKVLKTAGIAKTTAASSITPAAATLNGIVRPEGSPVTECKFEYGLTTAYGTTVPCSPEAGAIPGDFEPHAVSAALSDLVVGTTYHYRLVVSGGLGSENGEDLSFTALGPSVKSISFSAVGETSATLEALLNPRGKATSYHFEYGAQGPCASNPCASVPLADAPAGSGTSDVPVAQVVKGLSPDTTYHFRIVVSNSDGTGRSAESTFATYDVPPAFEPCAANEALRAGQPSAKLPDCRAYEQASPVGKNGGNAFGQLFKVQASLSGDGITSQTKGGLPGGEGAESYPLFLSSRGSAGWSTQGWQPPSSYGPRDYIMGWTPDLAYSFSQASQGFSKGGFESSLLMRSSATRAIQQVTPYIGGASYAFAGASTDGSKVFFEATGKGVNLTGSAATGKDNLYLYEPAKEELSLVGVLPPSQGGHAPAGGSFAGPFEWWGGSFKSPQEGATTSEMLAIGGAMGEPNLNTPGEKGYLTQEMHAISADGSKAFFTAGATGQIYLREGLDGEGPETVPVSGSQRSTLDPNGAKPAIFMGATASGSKAFFTSCQKLTDDSTAHSTGENACDTPNQGQDLYAYDTANHELSDLTVDADDPQGAEVKGVVGFSDDGSIVYFVANGDLDEAAPGPGSCQGRASATGYGDFSGTCNLYAWHAGSSSFVARLDPQGGESDSDATNWTPGSGQFIATGRVSADGQTVVFRSQLPLTGYDNTPNSEKCLNVGGGVCPEFFHYRLGEDAPSCISCTPSGAPPVYGAPTLQTMDASVTVAGHPIASRFVSASGNRVFFETPEKLVGTDTNGETACPRLPFIGSCQDVYEWEAAGTGSCSESSAAFSPVNGGCLYLLSTGTGPDPSYFGDASASGEDVFVFTTSQLVPGDRDQLYDAYDVKVGGGLASQNQPPPPPPCEADACRGGSGTPPSSQSAGSASFSGAPNPPIKRHHKPKKHKHKKKHHKHHANKRAGARHGGSK